MRITKIEVEDNVGELLKPDVSKGSLENGRKNILCGFSTELTNVIFLSIMFTLCFSTMGTLQNLQSSFNIENGLGVLSLASLYAVIVFTGMIAPIFIRVFGTKYCFVIAWFTHSVYVASNFYPSWVTLLPSSFLVGLFQSALWTSEAIYVTTRGKNYAKVSGKSTAHSLNIFNGLFFAVYNTSIMIGNLITFMVLKELSYEPVSNGTRLHKPMICGAADCPGPVNSTDIHKFTPDKSTLRTLLGIFVTIDLLCLILTTIFLKPLETGSKVSFVKNCFMCYNLFKSDLRVYLFMPLMMTHSFIQVIVFAEFTKSYISCSFGVSQIGAIMASYGAASSLASAAQGYITRLIRRPPIMVTAVALQLSMLLVMLWWKPTLQHYIYFIIAIVFGVSEGAWTPHLYSLVATVFEEKTDAAFYNLNTWKATGYAVQFLLSHFLCTSTKILFVISFLLISLACYISIEILLQKRRKNNYVTAKENK